MPWKHTKHTHTHRYNGVVTVVDFAETNWQWHALVLSSTLSGLPFRVCTFTNTLTEAYRYACTAWSSSHSRTKRTELIHHSWSQRTSDIRHLPSQSSVFILIEVSQFMSQHHTWTLFFWVSVWTAHKHTHTHTHRSTGLGTTLNFKPAKSHCFGPLRTPSTSSHGLEHWFRILSKSSIFHFNVFC